MNGTSNEPTVGGHEDGRLSPAQAANLDTFLDQLIGNRQPAAHDLLGQELTEHLLAAQLCLLRADVETPTPTFLRSLNLQILEEMSRVQHRQHTGVSRRQVLRTGARVAAV